MSLLREFFQIYRESIKNFDEANPIESRKKATLGVGDVFVVRTTHLPVYGVIVQKEGDKIRFIYLTTFLPLASVEAVGLKVNDLFDEVRMTHLSFETDSRVLDPFALRLGSVKDLQMLIDNSERLRKIKYGQLHREFFEMEKKRVELILKLIQEHDKIVLVNPNVVRKLEELSMSVAVAATEKKTHRIDCVLICEEELGWRLYFSEDCEGKFGRIFLMDEIVFEGTFRSGVLLRGLKRFPRVVDWVKVELSR